MFGLFQLLAVVNNAAMYIGVQVSVRVPAFNSLGSKPRSRIAGSVFNCFPELTNAGMFFKAPRVILRCSQSDEGRLAEACGGGSSVDGEGQS